MKVFFGCDITYNKKNTQMDGDIFVCRKLDAAQEKTVDDEIEKLTALNEKMLPKALQTVYSILLLAAVVCFVLITKTWENGTSLSDIYARSPWLFYATAGCTAVWVVFAVWMHKRAKKIAESDESTLLINHYNAVMENTLRALGAPPDCACIEILQVFYKNKNGKIKFQKQGYAHAMHPECYIYADESTVYFSDIRQSYAIPRSEITGIQKIKKRLSMFGWNKDTPHNKGAYKPYKIARGQGGTYCLRYYYALEILHGGEPYLLYFPPYELPVVERILQNQSI